MTPKKPHVQVRYDTSANAPNGINAYYHCAKCLDEWQTGTDPETGQRLSALMSPADYARTQTGRLPDGRVQVWCNRHDCNVVLLSFAVKEEE